MQPLKIQSSQRRKIIRARPLLYFVIFYNTLCFYKLTANVLIRCVDAQADLGLRCLHMPEDTFSHGGPIYFVVLLDSTSVK